MTSQSFGPGSPKSFIAYPKGDFDLESGSLRKVRKPKNSASDPFRMIRSFGSQIHYFYKMHPVLVFLLSLSFGMAILIILSVYESRFRMSFRKSDELILGSETYPFMGLHNLVMVAGHSIYTSESCGKFEDESSWYLEPYQKNSGQAATFVEHIKVGVEVAAKDDEALLIFSGGETRKDAGPRSEAQSYWTVADSEGWFGNLFAFRIIIM